MPMNWDRVRSEERTKRYGKEAADGSDVPPQTRPFGSVRWKRRAAKSMTSEEKRRWEEAAAKVYGKDS